MPVYSHSSLATYENCPLMYNYRYVEKLKLEPEVETVEVFMGRRVHEVLQKLYKDLKLSKENSLDELIEYYNKNWDKNWNDDIKIVKEEYTAKNYKDTGKNCITSYYNRYKPFRGSKTLGLEQVILVDIDGYKLKGFIDRLSQKKDGHYEIHDYKTSQYLPTQKQFDKDKQLALYQIGVEKMWDDVEEVDLIWHYLVHDKEIKSKRSRGEIEKLKEEIVTLIQEIENATDEGEFPPRESKLCDWCEYQVVCPRWKHIVETEEMPVNRFMEDTGVKLVNRYAKLVSEKEAFLKRIDKEIEELREAIVAFAKREGVEVIRGTDKKLLVRVEIKPRFPTKKEREKRAALDNLIKGSGKWMEVSDLNPYSLARVVKSNAWSPELVEKIRKYLSLEESYRLTLSSLREDEE